MFSYFGRTVSRSFVYFTARQRKVFSSADLLKKSRPSVGSARAYSAPKTHSDVRDLTKAEWEQRLTPEQFSVCREQCTEEPFSGEYNTFYDPGSYHCVCCGVKLFSSESKYDSGTGWPSFYEAYQNSSNHSNVIERPENSADIATFRTEVICKKCDSHLGHVFEDGPPPTGKRYCINSVALSFQSK